MVSSKRKIAAVGVLAVGFFLAGAILRTAYADSSSSTAISSSSFASSESYGSNATSSATATSSVDGSSVSASASSESGNDQGPECDCGDGHEHSCAHLKVYVNVVNAGGGTATSSDFTVDVTGNNPDPSQFQGSAAGTKVQLGNGTYNATEPSPLVNYSASYSNDCSGIMANGDSKDCNITDTYVPSSPVADISVTKVVDNSKPSEGDFVHYTITATDLGPATSTGVVASDTLPAGVTFVSDTASQGSYDPATGLWNVGTLSANSSASVQITATVNAGTAGETITNTVTIGESSTEIDPVTSNNTASASITVQGCGCNGAHIRVVVDVIGGTATSSDFTVDVTGNNPIPSQFQGSLVGTDVALGAGAYNVTEPAPLPNYTATYAKACSGTIQNGDDKRCVITDTYASLPLADIEVGKTVDNANPNVGDPIQYTITATDLGPATSTGVVASDTLPSGVTYVSNTASQGSYDPASGLWNVGTLSASSSASLVINVTVNAGTAGTTITNTATIGESASETDPNPANNSSSVSILVQGGGGGGSTADIGILKTVSNANPAPNYHHQLHFDGQWQAGPAYFRTGVVATDTLPGGSHVWFPATSIRKVLIQALR